MQRSWGQWLWGGPVEKSWEGRVGRGLEPGTPHEGSGRHRRESLQPALNQCATEHTLHRQGNRRKEESFPPGL